MGDSSTSPLGGALAGAIARIRAELRDPFAPVVVLVPAGPNGVLARRVLAAEGPQLRVWFETPEGLLREQVPIRFWRDARAEPPGWRRATLGRLLARLGEEGRLGRFAETLRRRGWREPLATALGWLEGQGVGAPVVEALAADAGTPAHLAERAGILAALLSGLEAARAAEGIAGQGALAAAATAAIGGREGVGASLAAGAVVLGDRELPHTVFTFLERWLAARAVVRLSLPGTAGLPPAPSGLAASAGACPVEPVSLEGGGRALAVLLERLFRGEGGSAAPADGSVVLARTPDDVRETVECVREVQRAVARGVALDRIAIVLPDAGQTAALEEALARAAIPATFMVGRPARELGAARLLRVTLELAGGDATPLRLYELLVHPALGLRGALGPDAVRGKGRWRRLLSQVVGARGLDRIAAGIERLEEGEGREPEEEERERAARASLVGAIRALEAALAPLLEPGPLGAHARAWTAFLDRFARRSESRGRLLALLDPIASGRDAGPVLQAAEAREELEALLERELPRGNLTERSIRVLAPMSLVGGELDVVCLLGLTEGRFPAPAHEDAILSDELLERIGARIGRALPLSREHEALERRRLAAALGAARGEVWLSIPGLDFETERPALPSSLALEALSALLGRRARYGDLPRVALRAGSRARSYPEASGDAVGRLEHLISRVAAESRALGAEGSGGAAPRAVAERPATAALAAHLTSRGVLQLHRSMHRARGGTLDAWTGLVPPALLPARGLDGGPLPVDALRMLVETPGEFFFRHMLRAWRAPRLQQFRPTLERAALEELLAAVAGQAVVPAGDVGSALRDGALGRLERERELGAFEAGELAVARPMVEAIGRGIAGDAEGYCRQAPAAGPLRVLPELPWQIAEPRGRPVGAGEATVLVDVAKAVRKKKLGDRLDLVLSALALVTAGRPPLELKVIGTNGDRGGSKLSALEARARSQLAEATEGARAGRFPVGASRAFGLVADSRRLVEEPGEPEDGP